MPGNLFQTPGTSLPAGIGSKAGMSSLRPSLMPRPMAAAAPARPQPRPLNLGAPSWAAAPPPQAPSQPAAIQQVAPTLAPAQPQQAAVASPLMSLLSGGGDEMDDAGRDRGGLTAAERDLADRQENEQQRAEWLDRRQSLTEWRDSRRGAMRGDGAGAKLSMLQPLLAGRPEFKQYLAARPDLASFFSTGG